LPSQAIISRFRDVLILSLVLPNLIMSFGFSVGDFVLLSNLAYKTVQNARSACGAHDSLTREVSSLHIVLARLEAEVSKPDSILNGDEDHRKRELATLVNGCKCVLRVLSRILEKYNELPEEKRSVTKLWQRVRFGNGEMHELAKIRSEIATYTQALTLFINLLCLSTLGKMEVYMDSHGDDLRHIKQALHWVTATMQAESRGTHSVLTSYTEDDKEIWKDFRRGLIKEGFSSHLLDKHGKMIKRYVLELGERGALDDITQEESELPRDQALLKTATSSISSEMVVSERLVHEKTEADHEMSSKAIHSDLNMKSLSSHGIALEELSLARRCAINPRRRRDRGLRTKSDRPPSSPTIPTTRLPGSTIIREEEEDDFNTSTELALSHHHRLRFGMPQKRAKQLKVPRKINASQGVSASRDQGYSSPVSDCEADDESEEEDYSESESDPQANIESEQPQHLVTVTAEECMRTNQDPQSVSLMEVNSYGNAHHLNRRRLVHMEEVDDEDILPGAHPNCGSSTEDDKPPGEPSLHKAGDTLLEKAATVFRPSGLSEDVVGTQANEKSRKFDLRKIEDISTNKAKTKKSRLRRGWSPSSNLSKPPWGGYKAYENFLIDQEDATLKSYRSETIKYNVTVFEDTETNFEGRVKKVDHFAYFEFGSGPDELWSSGGSDKEYGTSKILTTREKLEFGLWLGFRCRDTHSPENDTAESSTRSSPIEQHVRRESSRESRQESGSALVESSSRRVEWGSASERERREERRRLRKIYLKQAAAYYARPRSPPRVRKLAIDSEDDPFKNAPENSEQWEKRRRKDYDTGDSDTLARWGSASDDIANLRHR
jgi:hypothetical protein